MSPTRDSFEAVAIAIDAFIGDTGDCPPCYTSDPDSDPDPDFKTTSCLMKREAIAAKLQLV